MNDTMGPLVPPDLDPTVETSQDDCVGLLQRLTNQLLFGRDTVPEEGAPATFATPFQCVVVVGGMVGMDIEGHIQPMAIGVLNAAPTPRARSTYGKLAKKLRQVAADIERMAREEES